MKPVLWENGEKSRRLQVVRHEGIVPDSEKYVGFLTGSDADGHGFTIYLRDEAEYERVWKWATALTFLARREFIRAVIRRPEFAFAECGL